MERTSKNVRLGLTLPVGDARESLALARLAQQRGYEEIWMAEVASGDAYALAAAAAVAVPELRIGTAVVPAQTRTPLVHAMAALTLSQLTAGNFILGIGLSSPNIVSDWGGQPYDQPLTRIREHIEVLRKALAGERVDYAGKTLAVKRLRLGARAVGSIPLYLGALNEQMLHLAGALCDGVCLNMVPERALPQVLGAVRAGAEAAGRDPAELEVICRLHVAMVDDESAGRSLIRNTFGAYAATPGYNRCFEWIGFEREAREIRERFKSGDRTGVAAAVSDELCEAMAVIGDAKRIRDRVRAYAEQGVDVCVINPLADATRAAQIIETIAGSLDGLDLHGSGVLRATQNRTAPSAARTV
jgi:probable F420-dependent oxidoreductase